MLQDYFQAMPAHPLPAQCLTCASRSSLCRFGKCLTPRTSKRRVRAAALADPPAFFPSTSTRPNVLDRNGSDESQTRGSLHCLWPRYERRQAVHFTEQASKTRQLPVAIAQLAGYFTDSPLHNTDTAQQNPQQQSPQQQQPVPLLAELACLWRYQGLRI